MSVLNTQAEIITRYLNGALSHSAAKAALRAIGYSSYGAERVLKAAWADDTVVVFTPDFKR